MTILADSTAPPCAHTPALYQDELLLSPPARQDLTAAEWDRLLAKRASAHRRCAACPLMIECLYRAVVEVDVSGFVACTTEHDRQVIRRQLGIEVQPVTTTPYGAPRVGGGPVHHEAVMTARQAHPKDTCHQLAERLNCSTSTIKRHLRRAREEEAVVSTAVATSTAPPTVEDVLDCFDQLETSHAA